MQDENHRFIARLKRALQDGLPGEEAQWKMAVQSEQDRRPGRDSYSFAGVMTLLFPVEEEYEIVFIKRRVDIEHDRHAGQISFPGGQYEEGDEHTRETALRETEEEVGVPRKSVRLLGSLSPLFIPVSGYMVHPYVGFVPHHPEFSKDESEVQDILTAPLSHFLHPDALERKDIELDNGSRLNNVPYFNLKGEILWGATAMMLSEFLEIIRREEDLQRSLRSGNTSESGHSPG